MTDIATPTGEQTSSDTARLMADALRRLGRDAVNLAQTAFHRDAETSEAAWALVDQCDLAATKAKRLADVLDRPDWNVGTMKAAVWAAAAKADEERRVAAERAIADAES